MKPIVDITPYFFPDKARINSDFLEMEKFVKKLINHKKILKLYPYYTAISLTISSREKGDVKKGPNLLRKVLYPWLSILHFILYNAYLVSKVFRPKNIFHGDILIIGENYRSMEVTMVSRLIKSLLKKDKAICYLANNTEYEELKFLLQDDADKIKIIQYEKYFTRGDKVILTLLGALRAFLDRKSIESIMPQGYPMPPRGELIKTAKHFYMWDLLKNNFTFKHLVIKNHFNRFSSVIATSHLKKDTNVISLQHGILQSPYPYLPIMAKKYLTFGNSSANILYNNEKALWGDSNKEPICQKFISTGMMLDSVTQHDARQRELYTVLIPDSYHPYFETHYGIQNEMDALIELIKRMLEESKIIDKVIVRSHPNRQDLTFQHSFNKKFWQPLVTKYTNFHLSYPGNTLNEDLDRASIVFGTYSGAIMASAAAGIPSYVLWDEGWSNFSDVESFWRHNTLSPKQAIEKIEKVLSDNKLYIIEQERSKQAAEGYYANLLDPFRGDITEDITEEMLR